MSRSLRVLLIGRHFWPHGSIDSANHLTELASAFHRAGIHVEVLTPRYASSWPEQLMVREVAVHRPAAAPRSDWSMGRYVRHLANWLREHGPRFDILLVDAIRDEAMAAIDAAQAIGMPVALRCRGLGEETDLDWWRSSRAAGKCGLAGRRANALIANNAQCQRDLIAEGFDPVKLHRIDEGFTPMHPRSAATQRQARESLASVSTDLVADDHAPVLLCASRMTRDGGINLLVKAAPHLIAKYPNLRIWFIGNGPYRDWIYESLRRDGVRASIAMPGSFCDFEDLYAAADLFLQPDRGGLDFFLRTAVSAELPIVAIDESSIRSVLCETFAEGSPSAPTPLVNWCAEANAKQIRLGVVHVLEDSNKAQSQASELRRIMLRAKPQDQTIQAYISLLEKLVQQHPPRHSASSSKVVS